MVRQPDTHYAKGPEGNIAYQVVGDGPIDLVIVPGWFSHLDVQWALRYGEASSRSWHRLRV